MACYKSLPGVYSHVVIVSCSTGSLGRAQERSAAAANIMLQAQIAENIRARTELLSSQTQELNNYSQAIEEMLRRLGADPEDASRPASSAASSSRSASTASRPASASAATYPATGSTSTLEGPGSAGGGAHGVMPPHSATAARTRRAFASSILPGPLSSFTPHPAFILQPAVTSAGNPLPTTTAAPATATSMEAPARHAVHARTGSFEAGQIDTDSDVPDLVDSSDDEDDAPLHDLMPTEPTQEYGQSLMDRDRHTHRAADNGATSQERGRNNGHNEQDQEDEFDADIMEMEEAEEASRVAHTVSGHATRYVNM
jgi:DNA-binding protein H-NS